MTSKDGERVGDTPTMADMYIGGNLSPGHSGAKRTYPNFNFEPAENSVAKLQSAT